MGYTTDFRGSFGVTPTLSDDMINFLEKFSNSRRMGRNVEGFGVEGEFYVKDDRNNIMDNNTPPSTQAGFYCQWIPTDDGEEIEWDGGEKFYNYVEWIFYIVNKILKPNGYVVEGEVEWRGEEWGDDGTIIIDDNQVYVNSNLFTVEDYNRETGGDIRLDVFPFIDVKPHVEETITISIDEHQRLLRCEEQMNIFRKQLEIIAGTFKG